MVILGIQIVLVLALYAWQKGREARHLIKRKRPWDMIAWAVLKVTISLNLIGLLAWAALKWL